MCYTTNSHVNIKTELTTTSNLGYRADCNNVSVSIFIVSIKTLKWPECSTLGWVGQEIATKKSLQQTMIKKCLSNESRKLSLFT